MDGTTFKNDSQSRRFELSAEGKVVGFAQYATSGNIVTITHTEVIEEYKGKGYATELARQALDHIRSKHLNLVPACAFIAGYIRKHPEYADLIQH